MRLIDGVEVRPIPGTDGRYSVTSDGRVWSHSTKRGNRDRSQEFGWLSIFVASGGYPTFGIRNGTSSRQMAMHRAVALAWIENDAPQVRRYVNHKNGIKTDPRAENLEWCTSSENAAHAYRVGLRGVTDRQLEWSSSLGRSHRRLDEKQVQEIKKLVSAGHKRIRVAERFGVARSLITGIMNGTLYKD